jgi:hypothetical protein
MFSDVPFEPLSFSDARFDPESGVLLSLKIFGEIGTGFVPVLTLKPLEDG